MLNYRNTNIGYTILLVVAMGLDWFYQVPVIVYALLVVNYCAVLFYGCYVVQSNFFLPVTCSATTGRKEIALSFDDGPVQHYTPQVLAVLKDQDVKAAFFCVGRRISENENLLRQVHGEGHLIGNHSYSHHTLFDLFSSGRMLSDLQEMDHITGRVCGLRPHLFRPPYGVINPNLKKAIIQAGYAPVGWSVRSMDTVIRDEKTLLKKLLAALQPGAVFLFHDTSKTTVSILSEFISTVKDSGYDIVRLDKMLNLRPYA